jgi:hypothetical protein
MCLRLRLLWQHPARPNPATAPVKQKGQRLDLLLGTHDRTPRHLSPGRSQRANTIPSVLLRLEAVAAEGYERKMLPSAGGHRHPLAVRAEQEDEPGNLPLKIP